LTIVIIPKTLIVFTLTMMRMVFLVSWRRCKMTAKEYKEFQEAEKRKAEYLINWLKDQKKKEK